MYIEKGMVGGHTQEIDLGLKVPKESLDEHLREVRRISSMDKQKAIGKAKNSKGSEEQQTLFSDDKSKLKGISKNFSF